MSECICEALLDIHRSRCCEAVSSKWWASCVQESHHLVHLEQRLLLRILFSV